MGSILAAVLVLLEDRECGMATEALTSMDLLGAANITLSAVLLAVSLVLLVAAYAQRSPWSMLAGAVAIVLLGLAGLVSALARYDMFQGYAPVTLATLRISALVLLAGGAGRSWPAGAVNGGCDEVRPGARHSANR